MKKIIAGVLCLSFILTFLSGTVVFADTETAVVYSVVQRKNSPELEKNGVVNEKGVALDKTANKYTVSALSDSGADENVRVEMSTLLNIATAPASGKITPDITLKTDILTVTLDREFVESLSKKSKNGKVFFDVKKAVGIEDAIIKRLMPDVKIEINYCFTDANGETLEASGKLSVEVPFTSNTTQNVRIYEVQDTMVVDMKAEYKENILLYNGSPTARTLVSEENIVEITGRTLDLQGTISLVFYAQIEGIDPSRVKMLFWESEQSRYVKDTADRIVDMVGKDKNGYRFEYKNITSKDMSKKIYARLMAEHEDGTVRYSMMPREAYSVTKYAENMMKNKSLKPLLIKMLNYGTAAQEYFGSDNEAANLILKQGERATDFTKTYESADAVIVENNGTKTSAYIAGKTIKLEGDISINYYVLDDEPSEESGMLFWTEYDYAVAKAHTMGTESRKVTNFEKNGEYKVYAYTNIVSRQMYNSIYARAYTKVDGEYRYGDIHKYSVRDYAANQLEKNSAPKLVKVLRCLMLYGEEAKNYFDSL
ncbi:MAG: hypothetical protein E7401_00030 [Ruminococcaceae bacterium]|nr:hypothetical protein [Oscillospiraceae bacterium]